MERKIGEIFEYNGEWYQCMRAPIDKHPCSECQGCKGIGGPYISGGECNGNARKDGKFVIFKKLKKVGEPYSFGNKLMQKYSIYHKPIITNNLGICILEKYNESISIEIKQPKEDMEEYKMYDAREDIPEFDKVVDECLFGKQELNKEDMEEKNNGNTPLNVLTDKYVNGDICYDDFEKEVKALYSCKEEIKPILKEFDLEAAKAGQPVYTRDGHKARIICFDIKDRDNPIVAAIDMGECETVRLYTINGRYTKDKKADIDLMTLPEKKSGWVNVYKFDTGYSVGVLFDNEEEARKQGYGSDYIATVKVEWEE